jgi:hypothetical protein
MSEQRIKTMDYDEFQLVAEQFIERSSHEFGEMPASSFFQLLMENMAERVTETIELEVDIVDNQLVLEPPIGAVKITNNEILIGDRRIVVKLKDKPIYPTAG